MEQIQTICPEVLLCPSLPGLAGRRKPNSLCKARNPSTEPAAAAATWSLTWEAASAFGFSSMPWPFLLCLVCYCVFLPHLGMVGTGKRNVSLHAPSPSPWPHQTLNADGKDVQLPALLISCSKQTQILFWARRKGSCSFLRPPLLIDPS